MILLAIKSLNISIRGLLLSLLESIEFVVKETEDKGGAWSNFHVNWGAFHFSDQLSIQPIMIGTMKQQGISFISESKVIERSHK